MLASETIAGKAVDLAAALTPDDESVNAAVAQLAAAGDQDHLERARDVLVKRIYQRSDDFQATGGLTLLNKALAAVGWQDSASWKHRRKP